MAILGTRKGYIKRKPLRRARIPLKANFKVLSHKKPKPKSISKLIKECDRLFSIQVRSHYSTDGLVVDCFTCGETSYIRKIHCGHYLSRFYKVARWHKDNARPQCFQCNIWKKGDAINFRKKLIEEIGIERVEAVEALRDAPIKLSREFLLAKIAELSTL